MKNNKEFKNKVLETAKEILSKNNDISRFQLSRQVCKELDWYRENGNLKDMSCRKLLLQLERKGFIKLPEVKEKNKKLKGYLDTRPTIALDEVVISCELQDLGEISLNRITTRKSYESKVWNTIMKENHYLGAGPLCGTQIRYLVKSANYGLLGGLAFNSAAWRVSVRDEWMRWDDDIREKHLQKVVCNSRFLILPGVQVKNLASHLLSLSIEKVKVDWESQTGKKPILLETFVDTSLYKGTCYKAANWIHVGKTSGKGRNYDKTKELKAKKDMYLYPLDIGDINYLRSISKIEKKKPELQDWVDKEYKYAKLDHGSHTKRLKEITRDFFARPQSSIPQACQTRARMKAAYRFFGGDKMELSKILYSHYRCTEDRIREEDIVIVAQDTTSLNYSTHPMTEGLGPINTSKKSHNIGLFVHDTMAFSTAGVPLGLLDVQSWAREKDKYDNAKKRRTVPVEEKESNKWLESYRKIAQVQARLEDTKLVVVSDRESDIFEYFELATSGRQNPDVLVRSVQNRIISESDKKLWDYVQNTDSKCKIKVKVPKSHKQPAREATLDIRYSKVELKPPRHHMKKKEMKPIVIFAMQAKEVDFPREATPIEWKLLTTIEISNIDTVFSLIKWYTLRWGIEVYHKTLKSGCKIEERSLGNVKKTENALAIDMIVAWRIYYLTKLGRESPDNPCTIFFKDEEWKALYVFTNKTPKLPDKPPNLKTALIMTAQLGGFLNRKSDGNPGTKSLWLGLQRLDDLTNMWLVFNEIKKYDP